MLWGSLPFSMTFQATVSSASVNGLLHDLKAAGRVLLDVGKNGSRVKLVA